jgi:hypothetical protein
MYITYIGDFDLFEIKIANSEMWTLIPLVLHRI